ncbi:hypothetical protein [Streptomyces noursei]|uniref:hypothetical protein n=1 Tax=Streptomyces noursei TaxID=1971 RepID=UPI0016780169|nr:hypothetical protein [Streptomyces noursei]MCZ1015718.1 hypothetical protein [Streptomyces noursei]GGW90242.1 hypothetical protein GCM10010341_09010 [Streptomyces noursei]
MRAPVVGHDHMSGVGHGGERPAERGCRLDESPVVPAARYTTADAEVAFPPSANYGLN